MIQVFNILPKLMIVGCLCFQAYLLLANPGTINTFNQEFADFIKACDCEEIKQIPVDYVRFAIAACLLFSLLMYLNKMCWMKLFVVAGLLLKIWIVHGPFKTMPSLNESCLWAEVAVVGAVLAVGGGGTCCGKEKVNKEKTD